MDLLNLKYINDRVHLFTPIMFKKLKKLIKIKLSHILLIKYMGLRCDTCCRSYSLFLRTETELLHLMSKKYILSMQLSPEAGMVSSTDQFEGQC